MLRICGEFSCPARTSRTVVHIIRAATYDELCKIPHNPPNRTCGSPGIRLSSGIMQLAHGTPVRSRFQPSPVTPRYRWLCVPPAPESCTASPRCPSPSRRQTCSRPDSTEPPISQPGPFASACDASELPAPSRGVHRQSHSRGPCPSVIPPHLRPLSSTGTTPRLQSYGPLRHPAGPACPSRGSGCRAHGTDGASRVATPSIFHTCRRHYPGGNQPVVPSLSSRPVGGLPLSCGGSAPAFDVSRPAQRSLHVSAHVVAEPPSDLAPPLAVSTVSSYVPV